VWPPGWSSRTMPTALRSSGSRRDAGPRDTHVIRECAAEVAANVLWVHCSRLALVGAYKFRHGPGRLTKQPAGAALRLRRPAGRCLVPMLAATVDARLLARLVCALVWRLGLPQTAPVGGLSSVWRRRRAHRAGSGRGARCRRGSVGRRRGSRSAGSLSSQSSYRLPGKEGRARRRAHGAEDRYRFDRGPSMGQCLSRKAGHRWATLSSVRVPSHGRHQQRCAVTGTAEYQRASGRP
jgi:hypothetical protein